MSETRWTVAAVAVLACALAVSGSIAAGWWVSIDRALMPSALAASWTTPWLRPWSPATSALLALLLGVALRRWWAVVAVLVALTGVEVLLKVLLVQPAGLLGCPDGIACSGSSPSGHVMRATLLLGVAATALWSKGAWRALAIVPAALVPVVALAMVSSGWHWASDVAAGGLYGLAGTLVVVACQRPRSVLTSAPSGP